MSTIDILLVLKQRLRLKIEEPPRQFEAAYREVKIQLVLLEEPSDHPDVDITDRDTIISEQSITLWDQGYD